MKGSSCVLREQQPQRCQVDRLQALRLPSTRQLLTARLRGYAYLRRATSRLPRLRHFPARTNVRLHWAGAVSLDVHAFLPSMNAPIAARWSAKPATNRLTFNGMKRFDG